MNNLSKTLLGGVAVCALAIGPASAAKHPAMHVTALHAGHAVNKTNFLHNQGRQHLTYTFGVYTYVSAAAGGTVKLAATYYKWNSNGTLCSTPKMKIKVNPKKTSLAKIGTSTETYSEGCASGPTVFYGDTYTNKKGQAGDVDNFVSTLTGKFNNGSVKYKGTLNLDVRVTLD